MLYKGRVHLNKGQLTLNHCCPSQILIVSLGLYKLILFAALQCDLASSDKWSLQYNSCICIEVELFKAKTSWTCISNRLINLWKRKGAICLILISDLGYLKLILCRQLVAYKKDLRLKNKFVTSTNNRHVRG